MSTQARKHPTGAPPRQKLERSSHTECFELAMPTPAEILSLLTRMVRELAWLAVSWHVLLLLALPVFWRRSSSSQRAARLLLVGLAVSVAVASLLFGSPFNATSFGLLSGGLAMALASRSRQAPRQVPRWALWVGAALILYGWSYPHFVSGPWYRSLYSAPVGVVPCPTLAVLAGISLATAGVGTRAVPALLACWAAFYAWFGIFRLGVTLDVGLLLAALALLPGALIRPVGPPPSTTTCVNPS